MFVNIGYISVLAADRYYKSKLSTSFFFFFFVFFVFFLFCFVLILVCLDTTAKIK